MAHAIRLDEKLQNLHHTITGDVTEMLDIVCQNISKQCPV